MQEDQRRVEQAGPQAVNMLRTVLTGDCFEHLPRLAAGSIDLVLCDPPFGVTARNAWDKPLDPTRLWREYRRVLKPHGVAVIFAQGLFSVEMIAAARDLYRYTLVWQKNKPRGHLNAKKQPLRVHEDMLVFYDPPATYNPQMTDGHAPMHYAKRGKASSNYGHAESTVTESGSTLRYPTSIVPFPVVNNDDPIRVHPTQKPVALGRWLIRTFSNPGDVVLDNACGSGAFLRTAAEEVRAWIGIESDPKMAKHALEWASR